MKLTITGNKGDVILEEEADLFLINTIDVLENFMTASPYEGSLKCICELKTNLSTPQKIQIAYELLVGGLKLLLDHIDDNHQGKRRVKIAIDLLNSAQNQLPENTTKGVTLN